MASNGTDHSGKVYATTVCTICLRNRHTKKLLKFLPKAVTELAQKQNEIEKCFLNEIFICQKCEITLKKKVICSKNMRAPLVPSPSQSKNHYHCLLPRLQETMTETSTVSAANDGRHRLKSFKSKLKFKDKTDENKSTAYLSACVKKEPLNVQIEAPKMSDINQKTKEASIKTLPDDGNSTLVIKPDHKTTSNPQIIEPSSSSNGQIQPVYYSTFSMKDGPRVFKMVPITSLPPNAKMTLVSSCSGLTTNLPNVTDHAISKSNKNIPCTPNAQVIKVDSSHSKMMSAKQQIKEQNSYLLRLRNTFPDQYTTCQLTQHAMVVKRATLTALPEYVNSNFRCNTCFLGFEIHQQLIDHNLASHVKRAGLQQCRVCKTYVPCTRAAQHLGEHYVAYLCQLCDIICYDAKTMYQHLDRHLTRLKVSYHRRRANARLAQCVVCYRKFHSRVQLESHQWTHHRALKQVNVPLRTVFRKPTMGTSVSPLVQPKLIREITSVQCEAPVNPTRMPPQKQSLHSELSTCANPYAGQEHKCKTCSMCFVSNALLINHINSQHLAVKTEHVCRYCKKYFVRKCNLTRHILIIHHDKKE